MKDFINELSFGPLIQIALWGGGGGGGGGGEGGVKMRKDDLAHVISRHSSGIGFSPPNGGKTSSLK